MQNHLAADAMGLATGKLTGFARGLEAKQYRLDLERQGPRARGKRNAPDRALRTAMLM